MVSKIVDWNMEKLYTYIRREFIILWDLHNFFFKIIFDL